MTHYQLTKLFQAFSWVGLLSVFAFFFDSTLFLFSILTGWLYSGFGLGICHHRYAAHKSVEPRNRFIKLFLLFIGTIITHGSVIAWTITHRYHHKYVDEKKDPTNPAGSVWHKVKCFFYHFENLEANNTNIMVLDLIRDKDFLFFHKYHFHIVISYIVALALVNPLYVLYFYCIPICYVIGTSGWVTTLSHSPSTSIFGYRNYNSKDLAYNSLFWQIYTMGDGYHNNHHACPWLSDMAVTKYEFDLCGKICQIIGKPKKQEPSSVEISK